MKWQPEYLHTRNFPVKIYRRFAILPTYIDSINTFIWFEWYYHYVFHVDSNGTWLSIPLYLNSQILHRRNYMSDSTWNYYKNKWKDK